MKDEKKTCLQKSNFLFFSDLQKNNPWVLKLQVGIITRTVKANLHPIAIIDTYSEQ